MLWRELMPKITARIEPRPPSQSTDSTSAEMRSPLVFGAGGPKYPGAAGCQGTGIHCCPFHHQRPSGEKWAGGGCGGAGGDGTLVTAKWYWLMPSIRPPVREALLCFAERPVRYPF